MVAALPQADCAMSQPSINTHASDNNRLKQALTHWQQWCAEKPTVIRKMDGGLTNEIYLIQSQERYYVLRLNASNSQNLGIDRELEFQALTEASKADLAPKIIYYHQPNDFLITEFLPGNVWQEKDFTNTDNIHMLVQLLKSIHQLPAINGILNIQNRANIYKQSLDQHCELTKAIKKLEPQIHHRIDIAQSINPSLCVCHNDLLANNLIIINKCTLKAIDWEYAAMGDPFFDLAAIIEGNQLDDVTIKRMLAAYIDNDNDNDNDNNNATVYSPINITSAEERLQHSRIIYCYLDILWHAVQQTKFIAKNKENLAEPKLIHLLSLL